MAEGRLRGGLMRALQAPCLESLEAGLQQPEILVAFLALGSSL